MKIPALAILLIGSLMLSSCAKAEESQENKGNKESKEYGEYEEYYVTNYKFVNGELSDEFEVATPITYTKDEVATFRSNETVLFGEKITSIEVDREASKTFIETENDYFYLGLQKSGDYILFENGMPCYEKTETKKFTISENVIIHTDADPYDPSGIIIYNETENETMDELKAALIEREDEGYTPLYIQVKDGIIETIVIYPYSDASLMEVDVG